MKKSPRKSSATQASRSTAKSGAKPGLKTVGKAKIAPKTALKSPLKTVRGLALSGAQKAWTQVGKAFKMSAKPAKKQVAKALNKPLPKTSVKTAIKKSTKPVESAAEKETLKGASKEKSAQASTTQPAKGPKAVTKAGPASKGQAASSGLKSGSEKSVGRQGSKEAAATEEKKGSRKPERLGTDPSKFKEKSVAAVERAAQAGEKLCRESGCENFATTKGYCRLDYIKNWKKIKRKEMILKEGKLNQYIEELVSKYPDKYIDIIRQDLSTEVNFNKIIHDLELDESIDDLEYDGDSIDSLIGSIGKSSDDFDDSDF